MVRAFNLLKLMQKWSDPSFFLTRTTALHQGHHSGDWHAFSDLDPVAGIVSQHHRNSIAACGQRGIGALHVYAQRE